MGKICEKRFLDKDQKSTTIYDHYRKNYSPKMAEALYLIHMKGEADAKYSLETEDSDSKHSKLVDKSIDILAPEEGVRSGYVHNGQEAARVSEVAGKTAGSEFDMIASSKAMTVYDKMYKNLPKFKKENPGVKVDTVEQLKKAAKDLGIVNYTDLNADDTSKYEGNEEFRKAYLNNMEIMDFKREAGTKTHNVLEEFWNRYNAAMNSPGMRAKLESGEMTGLTDSKIDELAVEAASEFYNTKIDQVQYTNIAVAVFKLVRDSPGLAGKLHELTFYPEFKVHDADMNLAGTIDLLIKDANGTMHILDYKTKEVGKERSWNTLKYGTLNIDGDTSLANNKENMAMLQTGVYAAILRHQGFTVSNPQVVYIEGNIKNKSSFKGNKVYTNMKASLKEMTPDERLIAKLISKHTGYKINTQDAFKIKKEAGKLNSITELIEDITGGESIAGGANLDRTVTMILRDKVFTYNGKECFRDPGTFEPIAFQSTEENERRVQITKTYTEHFKGKESLVQQAKDHFKGNDVKGASATVKSQLAKALQGISSETHQLGLLRDMNGMEDMPNNYLVATDKKTGIKKIIIINNEFNKNIEHYKRASEGSKSGVDSGRTSVLGRYYKDKFATNELNITRKDLLRSNYEGFNVIQATMAMMRLRQLNPNHKFEGIRYAEVFGAKRSITETKAKTYDLRLCLDHVRTIVKAQAKKGTVDLNSELKDMFDVPRAYDPEEYSSDIFESLKDIMNSDTKFIGIEDVKARIQAAEYNRSKGVHENNDLLRDLIAYQSATLSYLENHGAASEVDLARDPVYVAINKCIVEIQKINVALSTGNVNIDRAAKAVAHSKVSNAFVQNLNAFRQGRELKVTDEFIPYKIKWGKLVDAFIEEQGVSRKSWLNFDGKAKSKVFNILYINEGRDVTVDSLSTHMRLKDPSTLTGAAKELVEFFNSTVTDSFNKSFFLKEDADKHKKNVYNQKGFVPIINKRGKSDFDGDLSSSDLRNNASLSWKRRINIPEESELIEDYMDNSDFLSQNTQEKRLDRMGISQEAKHIKPVEIETNLEVILDHMFLESRAQGYMSEVIGVTRAVTSTLAAAEQGEGLSTGALREFIKIGTDHNVLNKVEDSEWRDVSDSLNKIQTRLYVALSPKQVLMEAATNLMASSSTMLSESLKGVLGMKTRFNAANWHKAGITLITPGINYTKAKAMIRQLGIEYGDIQSLKTDDMMSTVKNSVVSAKTAFYLNAKALHEFRNQIFIAECLKDGSFEAYNFNTTTGMAEYNAKKDKRFFSSDGSQSDVQKARYEAELRLAEEEGTLTEDGELSRGYSLSEINSKKDYYKDVFGSMDKNGRMNIQHSTMGRNLLKFRSWASAKAAFYMNNKHESKTRRSWEKVYNDKGEVIRMEFKEIVTEGVFQTLTTVFSNMHAYMQNMNIKDASDKIETTRLNAHQKDNLAKAGVDLAFSAMIIMLFKAMTGGDDRDSETWKLMEKGVFMGIRDINIYSNFTDLSDSGLSASFGFMGRTAGFLYNSVMNSVGAIAGEEGAGADLFKDIMNITAHGKLLHSIGSDIAG